MRCGDFPSLTTTVDLVVIVPPHPLFSRTMFDDHDDDDDYNDYDEEFESL